MRKSSKVILAATVLTALILSTSAFAQAPTTLMYQGKLADASFNPITAETEVTFRIFDELEAGVELWIEVDTVTPNGDGVFTVEMGVEIPLAGVFDGTQRYLELQVTGDDPMTPRQLITSVPYSMASNVPGIAQTVISSAEVVDDVTAAGSITVDVPGAGFVLLQASGYGSMYTSATTGVGWYYVSLSTSPTTLGSDVRGLHYIEDALAYSYYYETLSVQMVVPVTAGTHTFYVTTDRGVGTFSSYIYSFQFTAMYIPSSIAYVATASSPVGVSADEGPGLRHLMELEAADQ